MEKKIIYVSKNTTTPYVPRYHQGTPDDPCDPNFNELLCNIRHSLMRGEIYDYEIRLAADTYYLTAPIRIDASCIGRVTFTSYGEGRAILSGGRVIDGFVPTTVNGVAALVADLPAVRLGEWYFEDLYVNKEYRYKPVAPRDGGKYRITDVPNHPKDNFGSTRIHSFLAEDGAFDGISNVEDTTVEILHFWLSERMPVTDYDPVTKRVSFERMPCRPLIDDVVPEYAQYRILNVFEAMRNPGEWYLDRKAGKLYYIPMEGETADNILVEAPVIRNLIEVVGEKDRPVGDLTLDGLILECTAADHCDEGAKDKLASHGQAAMNRDGAVRLVYAKNISIENCLLRNIGNYAVELALGCRNVAVEGCEICGTGAGGVKVNGANAYGDERDLPVGVRVEDCYIHDCTKTDYGAIGVVVANGASVRIAHNEICRLKYTGVSVGWTWGMTPSRTCNAIVEYNHIHHCGDGDMSDMGGVYMLGPQIGSEVRGNYIHDIKRANYGGWGVYLDEGSTGILVEKNICYDCDTSGFMIHYGAENVVRYNIFGAGDANVCFGAATAKDVFATMMKNIFFVEDTPVYQGAYNATLDFPIVTSDMNFIYRRGEGELYNLFDSHQEIGKVKKPWSAWTALGNDVLSRVYPTDERPLSTPDELRPFGFPEVDPALAGPRRKF